MEQKKEERLKQLLEKLPDIYENFATGITAIAQKKNCVDKLINYISSNRDVDTSAVVRFISDPVGDNW